MYNTQYTERCVKRMNALNALHNLSYIFGFLLLTVQVEGRNCLLPFYACSWSYQTSGTKHARICRERNNAEPIEAANQASSSLIFAQGGECASRLFLTIAKLLSLLTTQNGRAVRAGLA